MTDEKKKWQRFEDLAAKIQQMLAPDAHVEQDVHIVGKSGIDRQIDVAVRAKAGQYDLFIAIDCKDYGGKVDIEIVEAFVTKLQDVAANKGALITTVGFTAGAKAAAKAAGISIYTLVDAESEDWRTFVSIPVLVDDRWIQSVAYGISSTELRSLSLDVEVRDMPVFRADGSPIGPVRYLVSRLWNDGRISSEPGVYENVGLGDEPTYFKTEEGLARVSLHAKVRVARTLYFGQLPLVKIQGLRDHVTEAIVTTSFTTDKLDLGEVCETWQKVPDEGALAIEPVMKIGSKSNYFPEGEQDSSGGDLLIDIKQAPPGKTP